MSAHIHHHVHLIENRITFAADLVEGASGIDADDLQRLALNVRRMIVESAVDCCSLVVLDLAGNKMSARAAGIILAEIDEDLDWVASNRPTRSHAGRMRVGWAGASQSQSALLDCARTAKLRDHLGPTGLREWKRWLDPTMLLDPLSDGACGPRDYDR